MDAILAEVYSTVLPAAPYVFFAYVLIWAVLIGYIFIIDRRNKVARRELQALQETLEYKEREKNAAAAPMERD